MTQEDTLVVLFADVCGSTELYARQGDSEAYAKIQRTFDEIIRVVTRSRGVVVKTIGDEVMTTFASCEDALTAAAEIGKNGGSKTLAVRVGFHFGPVIRDGDDVFGDTVNVAARVVGLCQEGEVLLTSDVAVEAGPKWRVYLRRMHDMPIKGKSEPIRVFRLAAPDEEMTVFTSSGSSGGTGEALGLGHDGVWLRVDSDKPTVVIGRVEPADIVVRQSHVSRRHATVEYKHGTFYLRDHSTNGTFVLSTVGDKHLLQREAMPLPAGGRIWPGVVPSAELEASVEFRLEG